MRTPSLATLALIASLLQTVQCGVEKPQNKLYGNSFGVPGRNASYDYVVVGGGTAGLAIAARLAEDPSNAVAVIEAGGFYEVDNGNGSVVPALASLQGVGSDPRLNKKPLIDWDFVTTPQAGANYRSMHYARGKTLGGSSARNYMAFHRGTTGSYQLWADQVDDQSYTYDNLLPYFQSCCHLTAPDYSKRQSNGTVNYDPISFNDSIGGPLQISWPNWASPLGTWVAQGMAAIGIPLNSLGFNSGILSGYAWMPATIDPRNEYRETSKTSYMDQAISKTSLKVYPHTMAKRILFDGNKTANGVLVDTAGQSYTLSASKEVILSAGAFQSPQILMVSGIGPRATLERYNISVLSDLQGVGENMWDHAYFGITHRVNVLTSSKAVNDRAYAALIAQQYLNNGTGPLTSPTAAIGWEKLPAESRQNLSNSTLSKLARFPQDWPEAEYLTADGATGYNTDYLTADPRDGFNYGGVHVSLVAPLSRGSITISSADMSDPPIINPNWLTDPADVEMAIAAFKRIRQIWDNMQNITIGPEYLPGPDVSTDAQILAFIRQSMRTIWHAAATCAMGKAGDPNAVIDSQARVFGVNALRVVDASSFPFLPPGHPQATVYALAEKIADDILRPGDRTC